MNIWVDDCSYGGYYLYRVMLDGRVYDEFVSSKRLTWSQQIDVGRGYEEALDGFPPPKLK